MRDYTLAMDSEIYQEQHKGDLHRIKLKEDPLFAHEEKNLQERDSDMDSEKGKQESAFLFFLFIQKARMTK